MVSALRDYIFGLMLVAVVAQLEDDIATIQGVPGLRNAGGLATKIRLLRFQFRVNDQVSDLVDRIKDARNLFVHDGMVTADAGCTRVEMAGHMVRFLQRCGHPDYP